jgi:cytidylate kinase
VILTTPSTIALDGPAASGKTTVGERLATKFGYLLFDTGVMYRAVTLIALRRGVPIEDEEAITALAREIEIDVRPPEPGSERLYTIWADGEDVTFEIRDPAVDANVSPVSAYRGVREELTRQQRRIGTRGHVVMVGRDIGTVVLPDADLKIYLDATIEERARRRLKDSELRGERPTLDEILAGLVQRDEIDSNREYAPLCAAPDALVIDTTELSVAQVVDRIEAVIEEAYDC